MNGLGATTSNLSLGPLICLPNLKMFYEVSTEMQIQKVDRYMDRWHQPANIPLDAPNREAQSVTRLACAMLDQRLPPPPTWPQLHTKFGALKKLGDEKLRWVNINQAITMVFRVL